MYSLKKLSGDASDDGLGLVLGEQLIWSKGLDWGLEELHPVLACP